MTDDIRRDMLNSRQPEKDLAEARSDGEQTWTTAELTRDFTVLGFMAPFVVVERKSDGKTGTLEFTHSPRTYFGWMEDQ